MSQHTDPIALPHSTEAERTVLGACVQDPEAIFRIADRIGPEDFFDPVHGEIYRAILQLSQKGTPVDFLTVNDALASSDAVQRAGGSALVAQLTAEVPTASHIEHYAAIVVDKAKHRKLVSLASTVRKLGYDSDTPADEACRKAEQAFLELQSDRGTAETAKLSELRSERFDHYAKLFEADDSAAIFGIRSGIPSIDAKLTGFAPGQLVVIAARPGMGKSALALDIAAHAAAQQQKTALFFSLEMAVEEIFDRLFSRGLQVPAWKLERGSITEEEFSRFGSVMDQLGDYPLYLDDSASSVFDIGSRARRHKMRFGLDLLVVDYLQLIAVEERWARENQTQRMSFISRELKKLARELKIPVIALSQLNREVEKRPGNRPMLSDLRDSGSIEQDADRILMLYRDDYYNEDSDRPGLTDVFIRKNRQGPTGLVEVKFDAELMTFGEVVRRTTPLASKAPRHAPSAKRTTD